MKQYKVIALSVSGIGKKIYSSGDIVTAEGFPSSANVDALVAGGYISSIEEKPEEEKAPIEEKPDKKKK